MRKFKKVLKNELFDVLCDICGGSCSNECSSVSEPPIMEYATLEAMWGYCSRKDGDSYTCEMCESCFDKVKAFIDSIRS